MNAERKRRLSRISRLVVTTSCEPLDILRREYETDAHYGTLKNLANNYQTDFDHGLTQKIAHRLLQEDPPEEIFVEPKKEPGRKVFARYFLTLPQILFLATIIFYHYMSWVKEGPNEYTFVAVTLTIIAFIPGCIMYHAQMRRDKKIKGQDETAPYFANVLRDGKVHRVHSKNLVVGDVIELQKGDVVPADVRVVDAEDLQTSFSTLTGEIEPRNNSTNFTDENPLRSENLTFIPCKVVRGKARCLVFATGTDTYAGKLIGLTSSIEKDMSGIESKFLNFVNSFVFVSIWNVLLLFVIDWCRSFEDFELERYIDIVYRTVPSVYVLSFVLTMALVKTELFDYSHETWYSFKRCQRYLEFGTVTVILMNVNSFKKSVHDKFFRDARITTVLLYNDTDDPVLALKNARELGVVSKEIETIYDVDNIEEKKGKEFALRTISFDGVVLTGEQLKSIEKCRLKRCFAKSKEFIFVRLSPQQKLYVTEMFQKAGHVVCYFGTSIGDLPAMKKANVGLAHNTADLMSRHADLTGKFNSPTVLELVVKKSRLILQNTTRSLWFLAATQASKTLSFLVSAIFRIPPPLHVSLVVIVDLFSLICSKFLLYKKPEKDLVTRANPKDLFSLKKTLNFVYSRVGMIQFFANWMSYLIAMSLYGFPPKLLLSSGTDWHSESRNISNSLGQLWTFKERKELTLTVQSSSLGAMILMQFGLYALVSRKNLPLNNYIPNSKLVLGLFIVIELHLLTNNASLLKRMLNTRHIPFVTQWPSFVFIGVIFIFEIVSKVINRKYPNSYLGKHIGCF